ncbi:T6SS effector BTH_I2691 family protein [Paraburkholderia sp. BCC1886]|uniref:T6SS effector BTH_I2691 family protein n=1 Tax=Paraburkholderia sp. BCC1886 TaxID=2562670 RepID=UPI001182174B|nr:T6SS effector BTH_I2691 family protein [Paraburkholderia sp. BCC1886]
MATTEQKCGNCEKTGLPILPVRYAVLPQTVNAKLPGGISGKSVTDVALSSHHYGLRTLREGWLYLFYVKGARGGNYWEAYKVTEDGRLWKQTLPLPTAPVTHPACAQKSIAVAMDIIAIEHPEKCGDVYIAFSEYGWHKDIFKLYAGDAALRKKRMQRIEPAKWITGAADEHASVATEQSIDDVIEYMPGFDPKLLQLPKQRVSNPDGSFNAQILKHEATRYPLHVRQATPSSASAALVKLMGDVGEKSGGKHHPPMLLALWDGIGNVHELNGYRNDAAVMMMRYVQELPKEIDALRSIDAAEIAVKNGAVSSKSRWRSALQAGWEGMINSPGAMDGIVTIPTDEQEAASQKRIEEAGKISPTEAKKIGEEEWPKYYEKLNPSKFKKFQSSFSSMQTTVDQVQASRTADVAAWLKAPLLLATLHDYHEDDVANGKAFEGVVNEAINGLPSEDKGAQVVVDLVNNMDPTQPTSLVWRAFAFNQKQPKIEIKELLASATTYKATHAEEVAEILEKIAKPLEKLKTFVEFREKMGEVKEHEYAVSATERAAKNLHVDRLSITIANALFKWTGMGKVSDCAGAYLIRGALMLRIGISRTDTLGLIKESANVEPKLRAKLESGYKALRAKGVKAADAYAQTLETLASDEKGLVLRAKWNAVRLTSEGAEAATGIRIGGTLAIIELFCFGASLAKVDKNGEDYAMLVASGFSASSACLQASSKAMAAMAKDAAQTVANLKAITGYFGGASAAIGAFFDARKGAEQAGNGKGGMAALYFVKSALGFAGSAANLLTALSSSAPMIARLTGGRGVAWLGKTNAGLAGAAARSGSLATAAEEGTTAAARAAAANAAGREAVGVAAGEVVVTVGERGALLMLGRVALFMAGWEVAVVITLIQVLIWYFSDNDLQTWFEKCTFGKSPNSPPWEAGKQHEEFEKALKGVGLEATEGSE